MALEGDIYHNKLQCHIEPRFDLMSENEKPKEINFIEIMSFWTNNVKLIE